MIHNIVTERIPKWNKTYSHTVTRKICLSFCTVISYLAVVHYCCTELRLRVDEHIIIGKHTITPTLCFSVSHTHTHSHRLIEWHTREQRNICWGSPSEITNIILMNASVNLFAPPSLFVWLFSYVRSFDTWLALTSLLLSLPPVPSYSNLSVSLAPPLSRFPFIVAFSQPFCWLHYFPFSCSSAIQRPQPPPSSSTVSGFFFL